MKKTALFSAIFAIGTLTAPLPVIAQDTPVAQTQSQQNSTFTKKRYKISGNWSVVTENGATTIKFDENFKTKGGPDLKVFLSPIPISDLSGSSIEQGAEKIGILKSNSGAQSYIVPDDITLSDYKSVVIHCEAFSVVWGGFDL